MSIQNLLREMLSEIDDKKEKFKKREEDWEDLSCLNSPLECYERGYISACYEFAEKVAKVNKIEFDFVNPVASLDSARQLKLKEGLNQLSLFN